MVKIERVVATFKLSLASVVKSNNVGSDENSNVEVIDILVNKSSMLMHKFAASRASSTEVGRGTSMHPKQPSTKNGTNKLLIIIVTY